jgi:hypothetical protein
MSADLYLGADPGWNGGMALLHVTDGFVDSFAHYHKTWKDTVDWLEPYAARVKFAVVEQVHSMPKQGVASTFKFGRAFGALEMLVTFARIPHKFVSPTRWQGDLRCRTGGNKNVSKEHAEQLFPRVKVTHAIADALLLSVYAMLIDNGGFQK